MGKKYEKIGQADIYREKKESGCGTIIGVAVMLFILFAIIGSCSNS